jgi:opacity protein-like surface antigen
MRKRTNATRGSSGSAARSIAVAVLALAIAVATATPARAEGEVTGVIGGMLGGDLNNILQGNVSIGGAFDNGPLYGVRLGWIGRFVGLEGSFVASPSGLSLSVPTQTAGINGKVYFLEGSVLLIPIPGPVSPFFTAGVGLHSYTFDVDINAASSQVADVQKLGYTWGGGLKINIKALTIRGEVRDHITPLEAGDLNLLPVSAQLVDDQTMHNVEISAGIGIRF